MPYYGITQNPKFSSRVFHIAGTRVLTAPRDQALPAAGRILQGAEPSGYVDYGSIVAGNVEINIEMPKEAINVGRIPTPIRYYLGSQSGTVSFQMQEYQPEMVSLAAGGTGTTEAGAGFQIVRIGGQLPPERRLLLLDDFDVDELVDSTEVWKQYQWTTPKAQGGGTFTRAENERAFVIPMEYSLLNFDVGGISRLLEFRAIE